MKIQIHFSNMRLTIENMREAARRLGGRCLSRTYVNNATHLDWECSLGHRWKAIPMSVRKGHWCPVCASKKRGEASLSSDGLQRCQEIAEKRGGRCLSTKYLGNAKPLRFECASKHQWDAHPSNIFAGKWCPYCGGRKLDNPLSLLASIALSNGGRLLSTVYRGGKVPHEWECAKGHRWSAVPGSVKRGSWCPHCAGFKSSDEWYRLMEKIASEHGGKLLTPRANFKDPRAPTVIVRCANGHQWRTCAYNIVTNGSWCKRCRLSAPASRLTLGDMHRLAARNHGKCLSAEYEGAHVPLEWECAKGHRWKARPTNIKSGRWCPECRSENLSEKFRRTDALKFFCEIAEARGGKLLSDAEPKNAHQPLLWQCARGHQWRAKANNIQNGRWCPICSSGLGERICRVYFEDLFGRQFPSTWPDWLMINGTRRQLDGYCEALRVAFEHQGEQHYREVGGSLRFKDPLSVRKKVDQAKVALCEAHGVNLIQIPEIPRLTRIEELRGLIKSECAARAIPIPSDFDTRPIDLKRAWDYDLMERLVAAAKERGGKCMSKEFIGTSRKYRWECAAGHQWEASAGSILYRKSWCPKCHHQKLNARIDQGLYKLPIRKLDISFIEKLRESAKQRGGQLVSTTYSGMQSTYRWRCKEGHEWEATATNIIHAESWCPVCARERIKKRTGTR